MTRDLKLLLTFSWLQVSHAEKHLWASILIESFFVPWYALVEMTGDLVEGSEIDSATMQITRAKSFQPLASSSCNGRCGSSSMPFGKRKLCWNPANLRCSSYSLAFLVIVILVVCDLTYYPVHSSPLPSSSAWSLPTLNYLFKDTRTRSQSNNFKRENELSGHGSSKQENHQQSHHETKESNPLPSSSNGNELGNESGKTHDESKVSSTGRLISAHDIRLTDNWGWVRRGASDPQTTTEQRRKQNIRHSKGKHKQRHHSAVGASPTATGATGASRSRKKEKPDNLLCPFDEIRGPDGKCRKAPRFSLYRVGRK